MKCVLLTGASGYLGGRLAAHLSAAPDRRVRMLARHLPDDGFPATERVVADLVAAPTAVLKEACRGVDAVMHLAGPNEVLCASEPDRALCDTTVGTRRIAEAAVAAGVRRFVYISTVHVYGAAITEGATLTEDVVPAPRAIYGISRLASEHLAASLAAASGGMELVVLRVTNVIGAPAGPEVARWTLLVNDICRQAILEGSLELRTHGMQWRDFLAMADACRIFEAASGESMPAGTYNVGSGDPKTPRQVAAMVQDVAEEVTGRRPPLRAPDPLAVPPEPYYVSVQRLAQVGLRAETTIRSAIEETLLFCIEHRGRLVAGGV